MTMTFDGRDEAEAREAERDAKVTPIRKARGERKQNKAAAKAEALSQGSDFEFDGKTYHLDAAEEWDLDVMEFFSEGNVIAAAKLLFGDEQYNNFKTDADGNRIKRTMVDLGELLELAMKQLGVEPGESNS